MMQEPLSNSSTKTIISDGGHEGIGEESLDQSREKQQKSTLIEFPGTSRVPEWRKQLNQRVREVQERKAREAAEELAAAREAGLVSCAIPSAQLELVPDLEQPVRNPIVSKALERIERAHRTDHLAAEFNGAATAAAPALAPVPDIISEPTPETTVAPEIDAPAPAETKPRLTVVAPAVAAPKPQADSTQRKPVRVISDDVDHVALSYLESCLSVPPLALDTSTQAAPFKRRFIAATLDLIVVALMSGPFAAAIEFADGDWANPKIIGLMSAIPLVLLFTYLTFSIALTGRTLGMRMVSLRTIDLRTGLIPTGGQSIQRAVGYILALAFLGLGVIYGLVDRDRRTLYDRFSKTIVIRD